MKIAVLFPGQGSQYIGMGKDFVESESECAGIMNIAESVCEFPIRTLSFDGPLETLTRAAVLQPAITVTNLICLQALKARLPKDVAISCYAGHSLGEYSALCAAGVLSVQDTINLVERRGFFMEREGDKHPGGMRAVLGLDIDTLEELVEASAGDGVVTVANYNTAQQIVISGNREGLDSVATKAEGLGGKVIPLNVSVANHSPLVAAAVPDFSKYMDSIPFQQPEAAVYCNVSAAPENDAQTIRKMMAGQIVSRVRWYEIISAMLADGVDVFIEAGPKTVLKGMMRKIVPKGAQVTSLQFDTPESLDTCCEKLGF